jgi:hypothetical protein
MDLHHVSHVAKLRVAELRFQQAAVRAGESQGAAALLFQQADEGAVHFAHEGHLHDFHGFLVRHAQAVHKDRLLAHFHHHVADGRAAAVHEDHLDADEPQQDQVFHDLLLQGVVDHGIASVLDDHDLAVVPVDVRQGLDQDLRPVRIGNECCHLCSLLKSGNRR